MSNHPHICQLLDAFKTDTRYYLVFEHAEGGDLFEAIKELGKLTEIDASLVIAQTASALSYLHARKIVHRDIKPENLLLSRRWHVRLCDFGLACTVLGPLFRVCGTPTYCAPEVLKECGYGYPADIWSLGVLLHVLLLGYAPFRSGDRTRLFRLITQGRIHFELPEWRRISTYARDLVSRMMNTNVDKRPRAIEILAHPWILQSKEADD
ncbi:hypothetical protein WR25_00794 [Diploscapter pachys]|uniref:Protein kinase domain-containing protein n=1 Tax=Diploscapter pachys TaxID=2018661 RepID=A0A2A2JKK8_9BILA|nr:hypothetical protein WR25_00794 [Diploscapter pachys]